MNSNDLVKLQKVEFEMLKWADEICREHNLVYFLIGGTLLGAVRHHGFIPWDDDLDIAMPRSDYEKFINIAKDREPEKYVIQSSVNMSGYWLPFAKIRRKNTIFDEPSLINYNGDKGIFIDIFPLDYAPKERSSWQDKQASLVKKLQRIILWKILKYGDNPAHGSILAKIVNLMPVTWLIKLRDNSMKLYNHKKENDFFINLGSNYNYIKQTIPTEKYLPNSKLEFCGELFSVPNDYDYLLSRIYGDYMQLPPESERRNHNPAIIVFDE